jgi:hypothetical protein
VTALHAFRDSPLYLAGSAANLFSMDESERIWKLHVPSSIAAGTDSSTGAITTSVNFFIFLFIFLLRS